MKKFILSAMAAMMLIGCMNEKKNSAVEESESAKPYESAVVKDLMTGDRSEKIGEYSVWEADSKDVTDEMLIGYIKDFYERKDLNYSLVIYTDQTNPQKGVSIAAGTVEKNDTFEKDEYGEWVSVESDDRKIYYYIEEDDVLVAYDDLSNYLAQHNDSED